jgi:hypothetical protein
MKTILMSASVAALLIAIVSQAQQSPNPQPTQPVPCVTSPNAPNPSGNHPVIKVPSKWQQMINQKLQKVESQTGIPLSGVGTEIAKASVSKAGAAPCPPQAGVSKTAQPVPIAHLPADVVTTWLCNPIVTSTDPSHTVTFVTPDALTIAEPAQAGAFEADGAKADAKATVSCASLRRDPKNNRVFLAQ